jgi:tetratricopeptide (TPR) repeat protein
MSDKWNISAAPDEVALLLEAGFIYRDARRLTEAREVFAGVRALQPANEVAEIALGTVAFQEGNYDTARRHYRKALEINPQSAFAYTHLGETEMYARNHDAAQVHLKKAIELDPRGSFGKLARTLLTVAASSDFK